MQPMKTITVKPNQTIYDIAVEQYGTVGALGELLSLNPGLRNDPEALVALGIDPLSFTDFRLDAAVEKGLQITVDDDSPLRKPAVINDLNREVTTYDKE